MRQLELDGRTHEFCANAGARWDHAGVVIRRPAGATHDDPLDLELAKALLGGTRAARARRQVLRFEEYEQWLWPS